MSWLSSGVNQNKNFVPPFAQIWHFFISVALTQTPTSKSPPSHNPALNHPQITTKIRHQITPKPPLQEIIIIIVDVSIFLQKQSQTSIKFLFE